MNAERLEQLATLFDTDKASSSHSYIRHYHRILKPKRKEIRNVLEIGIGDPSSPSLRLWSVYFPFARIFGVDNNEYKISSDRILPYRFDQTNEELLKQTFGTIPLDLIIDDGCHEGSAVMISLRTLFDYLVGGGYYVIEDMHGAFVTKILEFALGCRKVESIQIFSSANQPIEGETIIFIQKKLG